MDLLDEPILDLVNEDALASERYKELGAYEELFLEKQMSLTKIANRYPTNRRFTPASSYAEEVIVRRQEELKAMFRVDDVRSIKFVFRGEANYPKSLLSAKPAVPLLYYKGDTNLFQNKCIAIVGSRKASQYGKALGANISRRLAKKGFTIVSGLADGIDMVAHEAAIQEGGKTIGVLGTPINHVATKRKRPLVEEIAKNHLLVSQVPVLYYKQAGFQRHKVFFLERNATISALSMGTVVVEAGDVSGSLSTARHTLKQQKKLFIPSSCFKNDRVDWPSKFEKLGAIRVEKLDDILREL